MRKYVVVLSILILGFQNTGSQEKIMSLDALENQIVKKFKSVDGEFALAFKDLTNGSKILINEREVFHAASTMKTPVMIEVFKQADQGKISLKDSILVENKFKSIVDGSFYSMDIDRDSGDELYEYLGKMRTIRQLVYSMITVSSNLATNIVIEIVDANNVMNTMRDLGAMDIEVLRGVEDMQAFDRGLNNTTTAYDLMLIFEAIAEKQIVNEKACDEMIEILFDQKFNNMIPAGLPHDVRVAHKTGSISGIQHDSGIVYLPDGRKYILVILSKELKNNKEGIRIGAEVSKLIYNYMAAK